MNNPIKHHMAYHIVTAVLATGFTAAVEAMPTDIFELSAFINSPDLGVTSLQDSRIGAGNNEFDGAGLSTVFTNNLGADSLGTFTWRVTNNSGGALNNASFFGFLDADIDNPINGFFNEWGDETGLALGAGSTDPIPDSFEIDEPGFLFGDIFDHLLDGMLDNTNALPAGEEDDVSMALGFSVGEWLAGQTLVASFSMSEADNGGLFQFDPDSQFGFFFNGSVELRDPSAVPEPGAVLLLAAGFPGLLLLARRRAHGLRPD